MDLFTLARNGENLCPMDIFFYNFSYDLTWCVVYNEKHLSFSEMDFTKMIFSKTFLFLYFK
jgi:hypothetical protein